MPDQNTIYLGIALLILVVSNILLGSINSIFKQQFDKIKLFIGIGKGILVIIILMGILIAGKLTPDIIVININEKDVSLYEGTYLLMLSSYLWYGKECLIKLSGFLKGNYKINNNYNEGDKNKMK